MVKVVISGLPKNMKVPKFLSFIENSVFKNPIRVRLLNSRVNGDCKTMIFAMRPNDARAVRKFLNDLEYPYAGRIFPIKCWTDETDEEETQPDTDEMNYNQTTFVDSSFRDAYFNNLEELENSSLLRKEIESIDLKIELIKKQRILKEEENKLLLEQKKSEMLNNIGPKDFENLAKIEKIWGRNNEDELQDSAQTATSTAKKRNNKKWLSFSGPCKVILKEMQDIIDEYKKVDGCNIVISLIYSTIRKRLVNILQGKNYLPTPDIVRLYRAQYPKSSDRVFLDDLINTINRNCCPSNISESQNKNSEDDKIETNNINTDVKNVAKDMKESKEDNEVIIIDLETDNEQEVKEEPTVPNEEKTVIDLSNKDEISTNIDNDFDEWLENDLDDVKDQKEN